MLRHFLLTASLCFSMSAFIHDASAQSTSATEMNNAGVKQFESGKIREAEDAFRKAISTAKAAGNVCAEATALRNLEAMYNSNEYSGFLETTLDAKQYATTQKAKLESVRAAWTDPRFDKCTSSQGERISVYGPALDKADIDAFENFYQRLRKGVTAKDKAAVAKLFKYPMSIRGARKITVKTEADFVKRYDSLITPTVVKALATTSPAELWGRDQGICVGAGAIWLNATTTKNKFDLTALN
jgi:hypothetical protein